MDSTPIYQYAAPTSACLKPPKSSEPILTPGYEVRPYFIKHGHNSWLGARIGSKDFGGFRLALVGLAY